MDGRAGSLWHKIGGVATPRNSPQPMRVESPGQTQTEPQPDRKYILAWNDGVSPDWWETVKTECTEARCSLTRNRSLLGNYSLQR